MKQITNTILMIQPIAFRYNEQTAVNNYYQQVLDNSFPEQTQKEALSEFNNFIDKLREKGINVIVVEDTKNPDTPDSIFPNNWISTHNDGTIFIYPMFAKNRRNERRIDIIKYLQNNFQVKNVFDNTSVYEKNNFFLEGTGSMVLDRENKIAYASISSRTNKQLFEIWCKKMQFSPISFSSYQMIRNNKELIYHTNVMMCIADNFSVICLDTIDDVEERNFIVTTLENSGKDIIEITEEQKYRFAGNMLQLMGNQKYLVMSKSAYESLTKEQISKIEKYNPIISSSLDTIEACGGGSARCMMVEIFLPKQK